MWFILNVWCSYFCMIQSPQSFCHKVVCGGDVYSLNQSIKDKLGSTILHHIVTHLFQIHSIKLLTLLSQYVYQSQIYAAICQNSS